MVACAVEVIVTEARARLLFVDDEPDILLILSETFNDDYDVQVAESGREALALLAQGPVDVLVTDQKMPEMKGVELVARARELYPELVCIMLTAYSDPPDLIDVINRGPVYRFISKPWDTPDLVQTIENALAHAQLAAENRSLLAQTQRRLAALEAFSEVSAAASGLRAWSDVVDEVAQVLARVVPLEASATLLRHEHEQRSTLTVRCAVPLPTAALEQLADDARHAYETLTGEKVDDDKLLVRFTGPGIGESLDGEVSLDSQLFVPLETGGQTAGIVVVGARAVGAFDRDDERVLDILANRFAASLVALRAAAEEERRFLLRMVECMADGLVLTDASGEVVAYNAVARELLGVEEHHELTARMLRDRLHFYPFELVRGWERLGQHAVAEDLRIADRVLHSVVSPVTDARGALEGVVVVLRNVTEERARDERQRAFLRDVAHEVRTPLTSVHGTIDLLLSGNPGEITDKQRQFLFMIKQSVTRMNELVDDVLDLQRASEDRLRLDLQRVNLSDQVNEAVERYRPTFEKENIQVTLRTPGTPVTVRADPARIDQVLNNLLTNAARFTPADGTIEVDVFAHSDVGTTAGFSVWNSGPHIKSDDLERIFDAYEQTDSTPARRVRGTGLGLPICRRIVEAHGGRIWAESTRGDGTAFVSTLPRPAEDVDHELEDLAASPAHGRVGEHATVLVVEDDRPTAYTLKSILLAAGFAVEVAFRADDAIAIAREIRPQVVLTDVRMPDIDGVEMIEILRHDPDTRGTPIIAISGFDESERARRARAHAFLEKPVEPARLVATISELAFGRLSVGQGVLVLDDDEMTRTLCVDALAGRGYHMEVADDVASGRERITSFRPDLLLLDLVLPDGDGFDLLSGLKSDRQSSSMSVIVLSGRTDTDVKVKALRLGADDYVVKPFDHAELAARVETVLRRRELERAASPTTRLPGGLAIEGEVERRIRAGRPFTLCYLDLDNLKAFNDYYGYPKADAVIRQTGDLMREVVGAHGRPDDFIGHVAGDDFVLVTSPERAGSFCNRIVEAFSRLIPLYYSRADRERGYIETNDREGKLRRFPLMGLTIVAVTDEGGAYDGHADIARRAAELKKEAKAVPESIYLPDDVTRRMSD
jgi:DNA-binding response OmpR family regulator/signal transduction histidine kinase